MIKLNKKITVLVLIGCFALLSGCKAKPAGESSDQSGISSAITQDGIQNDGIPLPEDVFDTDSIVTTSPDNKSTGDKSENVADTSGETNSKTENQTQTDKTTPTDNSTSSENDSSNQVDEILQNNQTVELPYDKW